MNAYFLSSSTGSATTPAPAPQSVEIRRLSLESLDGLRRLPLDGSTGWWRLDGSTGLEMPPFDVARTLVPGVAGSVLQDVRTTERAIFVPMFTASNAGHIDHLEMLDQMRALLDPLSGEFRIIARSARGERQISAVYTAGLEGADGRSDSGIYWRKFGLTAIACQPFAEARTERVVEFQMTGANAPFLGIAGGIDVPWPRAITSSAVIGDNMRVPIASEVPVYPTLELVGPMDSFAATVVPEGGAYLGGATWSVNVPTGVPAGSTLRLVTDPRARSIRLDGQLAAGRVARGSSLAPFYPGVSLMSVSAPGGTGATQVRISWRDLYRSLW